MTIHFKLYPKQQRALMSVAQEILYGGAAGSGKSYMMRVLAIVLCMEIPNIKVFLFRRMYKELYINHVYSPDGFLVMLKPFIDRGEVVFNKSDGVINFTFNGAQIYLCHAQHESDINTYLGSEIHCLLIDEATQFTEKMIRFIRTRVRLGGLPVPEKWRKLLPKIIYGTNPGGPSHAYLKRGFVSHGEGHVFIAPVQDGGMSREYVPARSRENVVMMRNDPNYGQRIMGLGDERLALAYLEGNWDLEEGAAFSDLWDTNVHVIHQIEIPRSWTIDRSHDYGYSAPAATLWWAESDGTYCIMNDRRVIIPRKSIIMLSEQYFADKEDKGLRLHPYELAQKMHDHEVMNGLRQRTQAGPADASIFDRDRGTKAIHDEYTARGIRFTRGDKRPGSRERGFVLVRQGLQAALKRNFEQPWMLFHRNCVHTISQIPELPINPANPQDVDTAANDHIYDGIRYRSLKSSQSASMNSIYGT
jgi:hypothetical protein